MRPAALALAVAIGFTLVGTANAGVITAQYDLTGSTVTTNTPLGSDVDQITGTVTVWYGAATSLAPISWARLVAGSSTTTIQQTFGTSLVLTGSTTTTVTARGGFGGPIGTKTVALPPAAGGMTGGIHCTGGLCGLAGFPASVPQPQTGPANMVLATAGGLQFTIGPGVGNWTAVPYTVTTGAATLTFAYVGQEISRGFIPEPGTASLLGLGLAALAGASSFTRRSRMR